MRRGRVVAEQSLALDGTDGRAGLALSLGEAQSRVWSFPIGLTGSGHQERLVLANSSNLDVRVTVRFARRRRGRRTGDFDLAGYDRAGRRSHPGPPDVGFSITVRAAAPIVAEMVGASSAPQPAAARGIASDLGFSHGSRRWAGVRGAAGRRRDRRDRDRLDGRSGSSVATHPDRWRPSSGRGAGHGSGLRTASARSGSDWCPISMSR